jgi:hypothetical protein
MRIATYSIVGESCVVLWSEKCVLYHINGANGMMNYLAKTPGCSFVLAFRVFIVCRVKRFQMISVDIRSGCKAGN